MVAKWHEVYNQFAELLHDFANENNNPGELLYDILSKDDFFIEHNDWIIKFANNPNTRSVDPIHLFSSFNGSKQNIKNRIERINILFSVISNKSNLDEFTDIDFYGCPSPFTVKMMSVRDISYQNEIWNCFTSVMLKRQDGLLAKHFTQFKKWYGIDLRSFTQFLFWIKPNDFIPIDRNTTFLLVEYQKILSFPNTYKEYKSLLKSSKQIDYLELTSSAYDIYSKKLKNVKFSKKLGDYFNYYETAQARSGDFKILGIKVLENISDDKRKVLEKNKLYRLCNNYKFSKDKSKIIETKKTLDIYKIWDDVQINISAIVGKNGQGKSTITELIYMSIYSIAVNQKMLNNTNNKHLNGLHVELYFKSNSVYRIEIFNDKINVYRYSKKDNEYINPELIQLKELIHNDFFYTIAINYSQYGFNSLKYTYDWITPLSHKNDGYQTPVVINPMRTKGNFDINREDSLLRSRLLDNILELKDESNIQNLRRITEHREAKYLILSINNEKSRFKDNEYIKFSKVNQSNIEDAILLISEHYKLKNIKKAYNKNILNYCAKKLIYICHRYKGYNKKDHFLIIDKLELRIENLKDLLVKIDNDPSHVTYKFKQAINYLRFNHFDKFITKKENDYKINIDRLSQSIDNIKSLHEIKNTIELIPPSIFKCKIILEDGTEHDKISSGENQLINVVSSIVYHIKNIDSVSDDLLNYKYVNIILDEVELYFHPDLQRKFIDFLLFYIKNLNLNKILGINLCFITHSPFILSDIINDNILFLGKRNDNDDTIIEDQRTFGANIYDLLYDGFFFDEGFIGRFAEKRISEIIDLLNIEDIEDINKVFEGDKWFKDKYHVKILIEEIGEEFLKEKLLDMYYSKFPEIYKKETEINKLRKRLNELENDTIKSK